MSDSERPCLGPLLAVTAWVVLAAWHPYTNYHLAPAAVTIAYPLLVAGSGRSARRITAAVVGSGGLAVLAAAGLAHVDLLKSPALFNSAVAEAVVVTAVATILTLIVVGVRLRLRAPGLFRDDECIAEQSVGDGPSGDVDEVEHPVDVDAGG